MAIAEQTEFTQSPYPGLRPFQRNESDIFFGRDDHIDDLVTRLAENHFLAVVGSSGSGKSSLVKAGLLSALDAGLMGAAGSAWHIADLRPENSPLRNLAAALGESGALASQTGNNETAEAMLAANLRRGPRSIVELVQRAGLGKYSNLLILVDQFEELFRFHAHGDPNEALAFVKLLLETVKAARAAAKSGREPLNVYIVITMRSDFIGNCATFPGLAEMLNDGQYLCPRLNPDEIKEAIRGPATVFGATVEQALVNRLINDMGTNPDQLPLMQHAMMRVWDRVQSKRTNSEPPLVLTLEDYQAVGGLENALSNHADEAYAAVQKAGLGKVAEWIFRSLQVRGSEGQEIRRPLSVQKLSDIAGVPVDDVKRTIEAFRGHGCHFLMPPADQQLTAETVIDISHESLIRNWKRYRTWIDNEDEAAGRYRRLLETVQLKQKDKGILLNGLEAYHIRKWRKEDQPTSAWAELYGGQFKECMDLLQFSIAYWIGWRLVILTAVLVIVGFGITNYRQKLKLQNTHDALEKTSEERKAALVKVEAKNADLQATLFLSKIANGSAFPTPTEFNVYRQLADAPKEVRLSFFRQLLETNEDRYREQFPYALHAVVGLDTDMRDAVAEIIKQRSRSAADQFDMNMNYVLLGHCLDHTADLELTQVIADNLEIAIRRDKESFQSEHFSQISNRLSTEQNQRIAQRIITLMEQPDRSSQLGAALVVLGDHLPAERAAALAQQIVTMMEQTSEPEVVQSLAATLAALGDKLPAERAATIALRVVTMMEQTDRSNLTRYLGKVLTVLGDKLPAEQAATLAQQIVTIMEQTDSHYQQYLGEALAALGDKLPAQQAVSGAQRIVTVMERPEINTYQLRSLAATLAALGDKLPAQQTLSGAQRIVTRIEQTDNSEQLQFLESTLAALGDKLPAEQAATLAQQIVTSMVQTDTRYQKRYLGKTLAALGDTLPAEQAATLAQQIVTRMEQTGSLYQMQYLGEALAALGDKLPAQQALSGAQRIVTRMEQTKGSNELKELGAALAALADTLPAEQAATLAQQIVTSMEQADSDLRMRYLGEALAALGDKLPAQQALSGAQRIVTVMERPEINFNQLRSLGTTLAALGDKLPPQQALSGAQRIITLMEQTDSSVQLGSLGATLAALGHKFPAEQAATLAQQIVSSMEQTDRSNLTRNLGEVLAGLGEKLPPEQAATLAQQIVTSMEQTDNPSQMRYLGEALAALGEKLPTQQALSGAQRIVALMEQSDSSVQVRALGAILAALGDKLPAEQALSGAQRIVTIMEQTSEPVVLRSLGATLVALCGRFNPLNDISILKSLSCLDAKVGQDSEFRFRQESEFRFRSDMLSAWEARLQADPHVADKPKFDDNIWKAVEWAKSQGIDVDNVPRWPTPEMLDRYQHLQDEKKKAEEKAKQEAVMSEDTEDDTAARPDAEPPPESSPNIPPPPPLPVDGMGFSRHSSHILAA